MRPIRAAATALVASLALSACNGADDPADPTSSSTPSGSATAPSTTPPVATPTEPALPQAATKATEDGARAFIAYYWDLINYAQVTGDVKRLKALSAPTCDVCSGFVRDLGDLYRSGGRLVGGANDPSITEVAELSTSADDIYGLRVELVITHDAQTIVSADGSEDQRRPGTNRFTAYLLWTDNKWRTDALDLR